MATTIQTLDTVEVLRGTDKGTQFRVGSLSGNVVRDEQGNAYKAGNLKVVSPASLLMAPVAEVAPAPVAVTPAGTRGRKTSRSAQQCECGCGYETKGGYFRQGHDSVLKSQLLEFVDGHGDGIAADALVMRGWYSSGQMNERLARYAAKRG